MRERPLKLDLQLSVPQRGSREYLQGGDILRAVFDEVDKVLDADDISFIRLKFSNLSHSALKLALHPGEEPDRAGQPPNGILTVKLRDGNSLEGRLFETGRPICDRIEGFEPQVVENTVTADQTAVAQPVPGADVIEHIVFATKHLHNSLFPLEEGRWAVVDFVLNRHLPFAPWGPVSVHIESGAGGKITASKITINDEPIGIVRFMVIV